MIDRVRAVRLRVCAVGSRVRAVGSRVRTVAVVAVLLGLSAWSVRAAAADAPVTDLPIMGRTATTFERFFGHITTKHADCDEYYARRIYRSYQAACDVEGVSLVVALAQMVHETDYLRFTGSVRAVQYNFSGLGATSADNPGLRFADVDEGVLAHVQHLKAYGSMAPLSTALVDPRFGYVTRGSALTVRDLTGRWATDPRYGEKIMAHAGLLLL